MRFHLGHPTYPAYSFYLMGVSPQLEAKIERLGPVKLVAKAYDWPDVDSGFRQWTDRLNALTWPGGGDCFSTCVVLVDDFRNDVLVQNFDAQRAAYPKSSTWRWPYLVLSARLSPPEGKHPDGTFAYGGEEYKPATLPPVGVETVFMEWKMYPLPPCNLTSLTKDETYRGLWLLPLVDIRYFCRNVPLNHFSSGSSSSAAALVGDAYPLITVNRDDTPTWFPPVLGYPNDTVQPANYSPISSQGTHPEISAATRWGEAVELQAEMNNLRIVSRDVRSKFNVPKGRVPHDQFAGIIADYPEDWSLPTPRSYHIDATNLVTEDQMRLAGGLADARMLDDLTARKLQMLFRVRGTETFYSVTIATTVDYPNTLAHLTEDGDGPDRTEAFSIPAVFMGVEVSTRYPGVAEKSGLVTAAKQWALLYYAWRQKQAYLRFPGIVPLIPNGHAKAIRWDFQKGSFHTTYIALEGVQGTNIKHAAKREPFYAEINGEGAKEDNLHGVYAFTEKLDSAGTLTTHPNPRIGYVANVNGQTATFNPARDETGKVAVPVGLVVWLKPGTPYVDPNTGKIFDHYLFNTSDLVQIIQLKPTLEVNRYGHVGAYIKRWNPDTKTFTDSTEVWSVVLD